MSKVSQREMDYLKASFSVRTYELLEAANLLSLKKLEKKTKKEMLSIPKFGKLSLQEVDEVLAQNGKHLSSKK
jgi:DNA-directed RNA polymerase alpha subunit